MLRNADLDRIGFRRRDAATRARSTAAMLLNLHDDDARESARFLVGYEAERLLSDLLSCAETLAPLLHVATAEYDTEADFETLTAKCAAVQTAISGLRGQARRRRIAAKLSDTTGRTEAEAALYREAAERLATA